jgi:Uma2 family endonuclease
MRDASPLHTMTVEEYLRFDEQSPVRHEFVTGEVYAMSGATARHDLIAGTLYAALVAAERGSCRVFTSDMRVRVANDRYYCPDVSVVCAAVAERDTVLREPCVVIEVTSPATARIDRREKLDAYRQVESLRTYLIVDHRRRRVERHWRATSADAWQREEIAGTSGTTIAIPCVDVSLSLDAVYRRVELPAVSEPEGLDYEVSIDAVE